MRAIIFACTLLLFVKGEPIDYFDSEDVDEVAVGAVPKAESEAIEKAMGSDEDADTMLKEAVTNIYGKDDPVDGLLKLQGKAPQHIDSDLGAFLGGDDSEETGVNMEMVDATTTKSAFLTWGQTPGGDAVSNTATTQAALVDGTPEKAVSDKDAKKEKTPQYGGPIAFTLSGKDDVERPIQATKSAFVPQDQQKVQHIIATQSVLGLSDEEIQRQLQGEQQVGASLPAPELTELQLWFLAVSAGLLVPISLITIIRRKTHVSHVQLATFDEV